MEDLTITDNERTMAALGHALTFVEGGIVGPLILWLVERDRSQFSAFHSLQSLYWGLLWAGISLVAFVPIAIIGYLTCGLGFLLYLPIAGVYLAWEIIAAFKAYNGEWYELPLVGPLAYNSHNPHR